MESERAEDYLINHECGYPMDGYVPFMDAGRAVEIAEQDTEERVRTELTRWHDPKEVLPPIEKVVEVKLTFGRGYALAERGDDGWWYADSEEWEISDEQVIGWREIHE